MIVVSQRRRRIFNLALFTFSAGVAAVGVYILYLYFNPSLSDLFWDLFTGVRNQRLLYAFFAFLIAVYPMILFSRSKPAVEYKTVTVLKCYGCDYREVRDFHRGDYVFKKIGACKACNSEIYISAIYSVPMSKVEEKEEEY